MTRHMTDSLIRLVLFDSDILTMGLGDSFFIDGGNKLEFTDAWEDPIPEEPPEDPLDVVVTEMCDPEDGRDRVSEKAESVSKLSFQSASS